MHVRGRPLHFGVQLQAQGTTWADYARGVQAVEELGFGSVWTFDHLLPFVGPDDRPCFETLTTLGAMAVLTSRARIGVLVNGVLYRPPGRPGQGRRPGRRDERRQARFLSWRCLGRAGVQGLRSGLSPAGRALCPPG